LQDKKREGGGEERKGGEINENKINTKFLINTLLKRHVITRADIPCLLTAIFEVSLTKHSDLGLLPSHQSFSSSALVDHSSSRGGDPSSSRPGEKILALSAETNNTGTGGGQ